MAYKNKTYFGNNGETVAVWSYQQFILVGNYEKPYTESAAKMQ